MDAFDACLTILRVVIVAGEIVSSSREPVLLRVPARAIHDPLVCRQDMIAAGRTELIRLGETSGTVHFLGERLLDAGEPIPLAAGAAEDRRLASWR